MMSLSLMPRPLARLLAECRFPMPERPLAQPAQRAYMAATLTLSKDMMMADANTLTLTLSSGGDVVIKLRPDLAPGHVERIAGLAKDGFYDGVVFHRVIPGFMAQGGDPTGTGMGGSNLPDLKAEFNSEPHVRGTCSMARAQNPEQRQQPVLHLLRRCELPRQAIYGLGPGRERHGTCRCASGRRAAARAGQDRQGNGRLNDSIRSR